MSLFGQVLTGWHAHNTDLLDHGHAAIALSGYFATGHLWEAIFENWESEFLQMGAFVVLTAFLVQKGSPESRRPHVAEPFDADPRRFRDQPGAPWPVRRGGWVLRLYEQSLGLAFLSLFLVSWIGHALGGFAEFRSEALAHRQASSPESKAVHASHDDHD